jgi:phosphoribosylglycinamide formyltransferase 2
MRQPGASAVVYGGHDAGALVYAGVDRALAVAGTTLRLFGKPEAHARRRMGVALARALSDDEDLETVRQRARQCAGRVKPRPA